MQVKRGDIYYADLSPVVGSEQGGIRPVLIIQNDVGNRYSPTVICAAITSRMNKFIAETTGQITERLYRKVIVSVPTDKYHAVSICHIFNFCTIYHKLIHTDSSEDRGFLAMDQYKAFIRQTSRIL